MLEGNGTDVMKPQVGLDIMYIRKHYPDDTSKYIVL